MSEPENLYISIALKLAKQGNPSPNPYVGAVLVKDGKIIGKGYHKQAGFPHAEIEAINSVKNKSKIKGSTLYVTLEPCSHYGKTPPCTTSIIKYGIKKVVISSIDPNPKVNGIKILRKKGIIVKTGILKKEADKLNEVFLKYIKTKIPFIILKSAMSKDKKIAYENGNSKWITGSKTRKFVHILRSKYDAILVGIGTVLKDDPKLTSRIPNGKDPHRIILDSKLQIPSNARVFDSKNVTIVTTSKSSPHKRKKLMKKSRIWIIGKSKVNIKKLLKKLGQTGITSVLVEGGSEINTSFLKQKLVDKFYFFFSQKLIGKKGIPAFKTKFPKYLLSSKTKFNKDLMIEAYPS